MKKRQEEIERVEGLAARWMAAETTDAEERELRDWFRHATTVPDSLRDMQVLLGGLDALSEERFSRGGFSGTDLSGERLAGNRLPEEPLFGERRSDMPLSGPEERISGGRKARLFGRMAPFWGFAAAAAVVLGLYLGAELLRKPYCYIDGVAVYDKEVAMQTTVYLESLSALDDTGRMVDELIRNN